MKVLTDNGITANRYLDIGCGDGEFTLLISKAIKAHEVYGADIDSASLNNLPQKIKALNFDLEKLPDSKLPFDHGYFDVITATELIEHLSYGDELVQETCRLLGSGGYLLITTPNLASLLNRFLLFVGYQPMYTAPSKCYQIGSRTVAKKSSISEHGHKNLYTLKALKDMLGLYNFEIISTIGCQSIYDTLSFLPVANVPSIAPNIIVLCRKNG